MDKDNNLSNYTIYSITYCLNLVRLCYVGSTINFERRKAQHIRTCFNINSPNYNTKLYKAMRKYGIENFVFKIEYTLKSATNHQVLRVEEIYRLFLKANLNTNRCFLTAEQKKEDKKKNYEENKEEIKEDKKKYYEENVDKIKEYQEKYRENNKEVKKEYDKKYREENVDKLKEYQEKYREDNKERLYEKKECVCGGKFTFLNKSHHENTQLHKKYILKNLLCE